jgi:hypothetical protein
MVIFPSNGQDTPKLFRKHTAIGATMCCNRGLNTLIFQLLAGRPISTPGGRFGGDCCCADDHCRLIPVGDSAGILAPSHFTNSGGEVLACDVVMNADVSEANTAEEAPSLIGPGAVHGIGCWWLIRFIGK